MIDIVAGRALILAWLSVYSWSLPAVDQTDFSHALTVIPVPATPFAVPVFAGAIRWARRVTD